MADGADGARRAWEYLGLDPVVEESQEFDVTPERELQTMRHSAKEEFEVSPRYSYEDPKQSGSRLLTGASRAGDGEVWMSVAMKLRGCKRTFGNASWIKDAIGIGFYAKDWAPIGEPAVNVTEHHTARFRSDDVAQDALAGTINIKNPIGYDICEAYQDASANLTAKFKLRTNKIPTTLRGSYTRTLSLSPSGTIKSISGGAGGLNLGLSFDSSPAWSIAHPSDPAEFV